MTKVLIIKLSSMGDIIHTFPAIQDLISNIPNAEISWLVDKQFVDIPSLHPHVHNVISVPLREYKKKPISFFLSPEFKRLRTLAKQQKFDYIIDVQGLLKSALSSLFFRGHRYGYCQNAAKEKRASFLYNTKIFIDKDTHAIDKTRCLISQVFNYRINLDHIDYGLPITHKHDDYFLFLPGTSRPNKMWPQQNWQELQKLITDEEHKILIPWSTQIEYEQAHFIANNSKFVTILPKLTLKDLSVTVAKAKGVFGVDTGLTHMAAAYQRPIISLYNQRTAKLAYVKTNKHILCVSPIDCNGCPKETCHVKKEPKPSCMSKIDPKKVWHSMKELV